MNNTWNLLFLVYRNVSIGSYQKSFSDAQISAIRRYVSNIKYTIEGLSEGRMKVGTVDLLIIDEPVTSASGTGWSPPPLVYGQGKDIDFYYILDHKDITLAAVFVPILGLNGGGDWLGLGGTFTQVGGKRLYTIIINEIYTDSSTWTIDGKSYYTSAAAIVHEMLHAVETNSKDNGWTKFEALHDYEQNGYPNTYECRFVHAFVNSFDSGRII